MLKIILYNRYTVTFGTIGLLAIVWNAYVMFNNDGIIIGHVVTPNGVPVGNATVILSEKTLMTNTQLDRTTTDTEGRFEFSNHNIYHVYLEAYRDTTNSNASKSDYHLYFRGQNLYLPEPLQIMESQ